MDRREEKKMERIPRDQAAKWWKWWLELGCATVVGRVARKRCKRIVRPSADGASRKEEIGRGHERKEGPRQGKARPGNAMP